MPDPSTRLRTAPFFPYTKNFLGFEKAIKDSLFSVCHEDHIISWPVSICKINAGTFQNILWSLLKTIKDKPKMPAITEQTKNKNNKML